MSETPQVDPRQAFGESRPTQPLGQAAPAWGPAAQGSGQVPPPMPGQAPPPVSPWSQPVPAGGPGEAPRGSGSRNWLIAGAAALAVAVIAGVIIATSGGDDNDAATGRPPGVPGGAAEPEEPGKAFTEVPEGCELIKASTIERIAPGTECTPGLMDDADLATMITRSPRWESQGYDSPFLSLDAHVVVMPAAKETYATEKKVALKDRGELYKVIGSRPVSGLGEEAFMVYGGDTDGGLASAQAIVREGNATVTADYTFSRKDSTTTQQQAEEAAIAAARDVLGSLS